MTSQDLERRKITGTRTARYATLLSVVLALALTAALAACGGSDAPDDRSIVVGGTVAPAADKTPLGPPPGSVATDREILVTVYNALDGPNWEDSENWLSDAPLGEWSGVTTGDNGRVIWLRIGG